MDLNSLLQQLATLSGVAAFITVVINWLKVLKVVEDGDAPTWSLGFNLIALVGLFFANVLKFNVAGLDNIAATIAQIAALVLSLFVLLGVSKVVHGIARGLPLIGKSFSFDEEH